MGSVLHHAPHEEAVALTLLGGGGLSPGPSSVLPTGRGWSPRQKGVWSEATAVEAGVSGRACPLWEGAGKGLLTHMHQAVLGQISS